jgi:predicted metal-dependent HD superfamily phosphohydrolase
MSGSLAILENEWRKDVAAFPASDAEKAGAFEDLVVRHSEPQRRYHGLGHLSALFELLDAHAPHIAAGTPPRLAVWWHDAVYDPQASDNEQKSAVLAREHFVALGAPPELVGQTQEIILRTTNHFAGPSLGDGDFFLDADIAILGAPPHVYDAYASGVRQEYSWAPDELFKPGRSKFLVAALAIPQLFRTPAFEKAFTEQARANMARELASLA